MLHGWNYADRVKLMWAWNDTQTPEVTENVSWVCDEGFSIHDGSHAREEAGRRVIKRSIITKTVEMDVFIEDNVKGREMDKEHTFSNNVDLYVARDNVGDAKRSFIC